MAVQIGGIELTKLTKVAVRERARIAHHVVPGLAGDLAQVLGRPSVEISLSGIFFGAEAASQLGELRALHLEQQPVDFFADVVGEGYFSQVLLTRLEVSQLAGEFDQFNFTFEAVEYVEPPEPAMTDALAGLNTDLLGEAASFMDDAQNALEQVSQLTALIADVPSFGDPTSQLRQMPTDFAAQVGAAQQVLTGLRELF
ncbi:MAG TPA: hypothetical protein VJ810_02790 [Blastocatellia bacterium]|nr:hypothetical protein [Blastocatellia bacterium]